MMKYGDVAKSKEVYVCGKVHRTVLRCFGHTERVGKERLDKLLGSKERKAQMLDE